MAQNQQLVVEVMTKNAQALDNLNSKLGKVKSSTISLSGAAKLAAGAFAALGAGKALKSFVDVGRSVQNLQLRFKFLFGSAQEGAKAFETLTKFAGTVPFSLEQIAAASGNLAVVSEGAEELGKNLQLAGNIAAVSGLDFQTVGEQLQKALSGGIGAADLLKERGIAALLGFKAGATVTVAETAEALDREFGPSGRFGDAAITLANTFDGVVSMLGDKMFNFQRVVGKEFINALQDEFGKLDKALQENADNIDEIARSLGSALATTVMALGKSIKFVSDNSTELKAVFIGLAVTMTALKLSAYIMLLGEFAVKLRSATTAAAAFNLILGANPLVRIATALLGAGLAAAYYFTQTSEATKAQDEFNQILRDTKRLADEMSEVSLSKAGPTNSDKKDKAQTDVLNAMLAKEKSFLDSMGLLGEDALSKNLRLEQENILKLETIRNQDIKNHQKYTDLINQVEANASAERQEMYKAEAEKKQDLQRKNLGNWKAGKFEEVDLTKMSEKEMGEITETQARSTLDILASQNKKFFQLQKAVKIADAIQNTYVGATKAFAQGGVMGFVTGALVIAAGMAQVNAIRSQQYPGRERGGGVMSGRSYLVGEAGPEIFNPGSNGNITPNNQLGGSQEVTVNFNINAVDAASFDSLLSERRDTIVGVINQALNERGRRSLTA